MNNAVRQHLIDMIAQYGPSLCDEPKRVSALLADLAPEDALERNLLKAALEVGVARQLQAAPPGQVAEAVLARLAGGTARDYGVALENARRAVDSWAVALGLQLPPAEPAAVQAVAAPSRSIPVVHAVAAQPARIVASKPPTPQLSQPPAAAPVVAAETSSLFCCL